MPVSHVGLTVSHLPTSCSFFLAALQPLGYRYIGKYGNQIGLGVSEADFFLTQETPGIKAGAAHVAFSAPSRAAVRNFYANALEAGGTPHGSPAACEGGEGGEDIFNAAVFDCDGNSVEVVFYEGGQLDDGASCSGQSRVLALRQSNDDSKSSASMRSAATTAPKKTLMPAQSVVSRRAPSVTNSVVSKLSSRTVEVAAIKRSYTAPPLTPQSSDDTLQISRKTLVGTILGAAAGAAVAYAMCKSEEESAKAERDFHNQVQNRAAQQIPSSRPKNTETQMQVANPQPVYSSPPRSVQNASELESYFANHLRPQRQIEPPPPSGYQPPWAQTVFTNQQPEKAEGVASKSRITLSRANTMPEGLQQAPSRAPSTLISSFANEQQHTQNREQTIEHMRETWEYRGPPSAAPSERRSHGSKSLAKSQAASDLKSTTGSSKHSSTTSHKHRSQSVRDSETSRTTPQVLDQIPEKAPSSRSSVLGRSAVDRDDEPPYPSSSERDTGNDSDTVVPSDSISCVGSSRRSSHRTSSQTHSSSPQQPSPLQFSARTLSGSSASKRDDSRRASEAPHTSPPSQVSSRSSKSKRTCSSSETGSKSSHHRKHRRDRRDSKDDKAMRPDSIEEADEDSESEDEQQSTITPGKYSKYVDSKGVAAGMGRSGSEAHTLPIRGITQSMIDGHTGGKRGVASYAG